VTRKNERPTGSITIQGRALVAPSSGLDRVNIRIENGVIASIEKPKDCELIFDDDCLILPGFIDLHVHCREDPSGAQNYKEDFRTAGEAARCGGVVAMADMPNNPEPPNTAERYRAKRALAERSAVDVLPYALAQPEAGPFAKNVPYKLYLSEKAGATDDGLAHLFETFSGTWLAVHAEDPAILKQCADRATHEERRPPEAEITAVRRLIECLRAHPRLHLHVCHVSTAPAVDLIAEAKEAGLPVSCEVCCHHLLFDRDSFPRNLGDFAAVNPPLRSAKDRLALFEALARGVIDALATDHAPHLPEEKRAGAAGYPGLDAYGAFVTQLVRDLPLARVVSVTAEFPARFWKRFTGETRGSIERGAIGSLSVIGPLTWPGIRKLAFSTKCGWSPYVGHVFPGTVYATIVRGMVAYLAEPLRAA
jgi:dihydroorotase